MSLELSDALGAVVLSCSFLDLGSFQVPDAARSAWLAANPTPSARLTVRYDSEQSVDYNSRGGSLIHVVFRLSAGEEFPILFQ
jgi:hypothetical protein